MKPGLYVARQSHRSRTNRIQIESICFDFDKVGGPNSRLTEEWVRHQAQSWCGWIKSQHPKDDVFVIEIKEPVEDE